MWRYSDPTVSLIPLYASPQPANPAHDGARLSSNPVDDSREPDAVANPAQVTDASYDSVALEAARDIIKLTRRGKFDDQLKAKIQVRIIDAITAAIGAGGQAVAHPDDAAVDRFAIAMKAKLAKKRAEGRGGWDSRAECSTERLSYLLVQHIIKGDPLDVGNLAMMLHQRGDRIVTNDDTRSTANLSHPGWRLVPEKPTVEMLKAAGECFDGLKSLNGGATGADYYRAMLSVAPALSQPHPADERVEGKPVELSYTNYRGETARRTFTPKRVWFGSTEWHPEPQWLLTAYDHDKQADRDFALKDFGTADERVVEALDVDALAQEIRRVDGNHDLGAGQLAEALMPFLSSKEGRS
jgi:hypothetical protein